MFYKLHYMTLLLMAVPVSLAQNQRADPLSLPSVLVESPITPSRLSAGNDKNVCTLSVDSHALMALHNKYRQQGRRCGANYKSSVSPLKYSCLLAKASLAHTQDMVENTFLGHAGTDGSDTGVRANRVKYSWRRIGENVAQGFTSAAAVNQAWINSHDHCKNIMNADYTEMGAARIDNYWTVTFGRQK